MLGGEDFGRQDLGPGHHREGVGAQGGVLAGAFVQAVAPGPRGLAKLGFQGGDDGGGEPQAAQALGALVAPDSGMSTW